MTIAHIITLLATGIGAGFASGFLGVGGSFIMTPVQYGIFTAMGISEDTAIRLAIGTSLMVILPTATSGAWRHYKKGAVWWKTALIMGSCGLACAYGGATLASYLPGTALKIIFGAVVLSAAIGMLILRPVESNEEPKNNPWLWLACGVPIGLVSGLTGLGGGVIAVPIMVLALKFKMHNAVATSLVVIMITCIGGIIRYILGGQGIPDIPAYSIGYVNLQSWALLVATSVGMAQVGAITAHRLPAKQLRYVFIGVMFYMGLKMLGVFA